MISKKLLSLLIVGALRSTIALGMESQPALNQNFNFDRFFMNEENFPITKLATGFYKNEPCLISLSSGHIALHSLKSYKMVSGTTWNYKCTFPRRTAAATNLSTGGIGLVCTAFREKMYAKCPCNKGTISKNLYQITYLNFNHNVAETRSIPTLLWENQQFQGIKIMEFLNDNFIVLSYSDNSMKIFNMLDATITPIGYHQDVSYIATFGDNQFASSSSNGTVKIWDLASDNVTTIQGAGEIVSLLPLNDHTLVVGSKTDGADSTTPLTGTIINVNDDYYAPWFNYYGNVAKLNDEVIIYLQDYETLTFVVHNIQTEEKFTIQPFQNLSVLSDYDSSKSLLTTFEGRIIFAMPQRENYIYEKDEVHFELIAFVAQEAIILS